MTRILPGFGFVLSLALTTSVPAQSTIVMAKAASVAPEGTPWALWFESVLKRMQSDSAGKLQIKTYLSGKAGGEREIVEEVKRGSIQIFGGSVGALASTYVPELNAFELPFLFKSDAEVDFVLNQMRPAVSKLLEQKGFVLAQWSENGWHGYATKKKCTWAPADLVGLRMRSQQSAIHLDTYRAFGATPVEMAVPEVLSALETGVVDGFSNTPVFALSSAWYRPMKYFSYTKHIYQPAMIVVSKKWLDALTPELKKVVLAPIEEASGLALLRGLVDPTLKKLSDAKLEICQVKESQRELFAQKIKPVWEKFEQKSGANKLFLDQILSSKTKAKTHRL
jgi:TRAP-type C4-dicarboxylate transport system substrate-binding protein